MSPIETAQDQFTLSVKFESIRRMGPRYAMQYDLTGNTGLALDAHSRPSLPPTPRLRPKPSASFFALFKKGALRLAFAIPGESRQSELAAVKMEESLLNDVQAALVSGSVG